MSGGSLGGGGDAWAKDHEEILEHARGLGYDKVEGVSLPPADAPKETWIAEMDKFNAWKASELAKPEASRWWVTRPWSATEGTVRPESGGGGGSASVARPTASPSPVAGNPYYPQLVQEYDAPGLMDYSAYMPADSLFGYEQYQPYTNPNAIDPSIFNYQPPTIYASDPRLAGEGGYIRPTTSFGRMGIGGFGIEDGSSKTTSTDSRADLGAFDPDEIVDVPGNTSGIDITLGELVAASDASNTSPRFSPGTGLFGSPDLRADRAAAAIEAHVTKGLIDYTPSLEKDFAIVGQGGDYQADQAQARIDAVAREILKENSKAILGGNTSMSSPVSMVVNTAIPMKSGGSYIPADAHLGPGAAK